VKIIPVRAPPPKRNIIRNIKMSVTRGLEQESLMTAASSEKK
jgi:hypothetical protein